MLGIGIYFVAINTIRTEAELKWTVRWLMLAGWGCGAIAVLFYILPQDATVWVLDRLVRFDYPGGVGALRWIEDDPEGTMRAIGTAIDPNVLGGMMILVGGLLTPQLFARERLFPRWLVTIMLGTALLIIGAAGLAQISPADSIRHCGWTAIALVTPNTGVCSSSL